MTSSDSKGRRGIAFITTCAMACLHLASPLIAAGYHLTFSDEFNRFDSSRWQTSDYWGMRNNPGDYQGQWFCDPAYVPSGIDLKPYNPFRSHEGILTIRAEPTPAGIYSGAPPNSKSQPYVSGQLTGAHKFTQRYGYYEARAKLPPGKGLWSRFWLLTDDGIWPGEYDIFEVLGRENPTTIHQTTHYRDPISKHGIDGRTYDGIVPTDGKFHTYGLLWEPRTVTWYVDGVATLRQENRIHKPMYALLDLAVGKDPGNTWPGSADESTPWPAVMELDYFRVYSNDPSLPGVVPDAGYTPSVLPEGITIETTPTTALLPAGWSAGDIGSPELEGSSTWNPATGEWMVKSSGFGSQCHFAGKPLSGDGGVIATVVTTSSINSNDVTSGVMIRETTATDSRQVSLLHTTSLKHPDLTRHVTLRSRDKPGGEVKTLANIPIIDESVTLLLMRSGDTINGLYSSDAGTTWTLVGTSEMGSMAEAVTAGIAVAGNQNNYHRLARSTFRNVTVGQAAPTLASAADSVVTGGTVTFTPSLISQFTGAGLSTGPVTWSVVSGGGTIDGNGVYTAPALLGTGKATIKAAFDPYSVSREIAIKLPEPWTVPSLVHTPPGDAGSVSGVWTIVGGGTGISTNGNKDSFRFVSSAKDGNHTITAKIHESSGTQAGLVIRDSAEPGDAFAGARGRYSGIWLTATGLQWATRESPGGTAAPRAQVSTPAMPVWLRLTRSGPSAGIFTAHYSADGITWNQLGSPRTFAMSHTAQVGLAVASGSAMATATATFSELSAVPEKTDPVKTGNALR